jgi:BlaI family penicillinase repressor
MKDLKELTKAEEQIMQIIWDIEKGFVRDVIDQLPYPKPAYNTVSTIVRILESKGFVSHESFGKSHRYFPMVTKEEYRAFMATKLLNGYFDNSVQNMLSYFIEEKKLDLKEADQLLSLIENAKKNQS